MRLWVRILVVVLFTAASVVRMADASTMNLGMALAGTSGMNMADCKGCPDDGSNHTASGCVSICAVALMILPRLSQITFEVIAGEPYDLTKRGITGRTGPPEPRPPQSIIPS